MRSGWELKQLRIKCQFTDTGRPVRESYATHQHTNTLRRG